MTIPVRLALLLSLVLASCQATASVTRLPPDIAGKFEFSEQDVETARGESDGLPVRFLEVEDVRGGGVSFVLDGTPRDVRDMMLDFEGANGRREWCEKYESVFVSETEAESIWHFKRYKIFKPVVRLLYEIQEIDDGDEIVIEFRAAEPAAGVAALFGQYRMSRLDAEPPTTLMHARVFIDTGFPIGVSDDDMESGLRTDAQNLRDWIRARLYDS